MNSFCFHHLKTQHQIKTKRNPRNLSKEQQQSDSKHQILVLTCIMFWELIVTIDNTKFSGYFHISSLRDTLQ